MNLQADTSEVMSAAIDLHRNHLSLTSYDHARDLADLEIILSGSASTGQQISIFIARIGGGLAAPVTWIGIFFISLIAWIWRRRLRQNKNPEPHNYETPANNKGNVETSTFRREPSSSAPLSVGITNK